MTDEGIKNYFGNVIIYSAKCSLDDIKEYQKQNSNSTNYLKLGRTIYFSCAKPCDKEGVVVAFDNREVV